jgi:Tfp pilus assembly protein PilF
LRISGLKRRYPLRIIRALKTSARASAILLILFAVGVVYWPVLGCGFVWDDTALVLRDPFIRSWRLIGEGFRHFLFTDATPSDFYRPLQRASYTLDYALFGFAPWGWHLLGVAWHAAAAAALFAFLDEWLKNRRVALTAALLWAVHPLHTSAVCYVAGRADLLAALFVFLALGLSLRSRSPWPAALCALGALLSKEMGAVVFALLPVVLWQAGRREKIARLSLPCVLVAVVYAALRFSAQHEAPPRLSPPPAASERPVLAARAAGEYAALLVAPMNLHMERDVRGGTPARRAQTAAGIVILAALLLWGLRSAHRAKLAGGEGARHPVPALLLAAAVAYLPVSNVFALNATVAEHWLYLPSAFLLALAAGAVPWRWVLVVWIFALGARTCLRTFDWVDQRTFVERTITAGGDSARMRVALAALQLAGGETGSARNNYRMALEKEPGLPFAQLGLAHVEIGEGDFAAARRNLDAVERHSFLRASALQARAVLEFAESGKDPGASLEAAARSAPGDWPVVRRFVVFLVESGRKADAVRELRQLLEREPWRGEPWRMLGGILADAGRRDDARVAFGQAAALDVHDAVAKEMLAAAAR